MIESLSWFIHELQNSEETDSVHGVENCRYQDFRWALSRATDSDR